MKNTDLLNKEKKAFGYSPGKTATPSRNATAYPNPETLATILVHDLLFAQRGISLSKVHKLRQAVEAHSKLLSSEISKHKALFGESVNPEGVAATVQDDEEESPVTIRWMRVNTIKWSVEDATHWLVASGWTEIHFDEFMQRPEDKQQVFARDEHLSSVLALSRTVNINTLVPYLDGRLIAQDKASCMPAQLLLGSLTLQERKQGICVIDATAAPGNKTTMLSALVGTSGKVWAFEKDLERFQTLKSMVVKAGCRNVECILGDFLSVKTNDSRFHNVTHILLDPSCSGSGISNRLDHLVGTQRDESRINSLARFQTTILSHALRFKSVVQVAYSTCSIWREEDEEVVFRVLAKPEMSKKGWQLKELTDALKPGKPWKRLGRPGSDHEKALTDRMVRFDPKLDTTIGFFAAVFIRDVSNPSIGSEHFNLSHSSQSQPCSTEPICIEKGLRQSHKRWHGVRTGRLLYL